MSYCRAEDAGLGTGCLVSLSPSNLSVMRCGVYYLLCYVSRSDVVVACVPGVSGAPLPPAVGNLASAPSVIIGSSSETLISCRLMNISRDDVHDDIGNAGLLLLGSFGARLINLNGDAKLWSCSLETLAGNDEFDQDAKPGALFARGAAVCSKDSSIIALGLSNGFICLVYRISGELLRRLFGGHHSNKRFSVVALDASDSHLVSVNNSNEICVFDIESDFAVTQRISVSASTEDLSTALCLHGDNIVVGYISGHIRIFSAQMGQILFEIAAHGRCVTGLSAHPSKAEVSSCGEDQCLNVWSLPSARADASVSSVELVYHDLVENALLTGMQWADGRLYASAYDSDIIRVVVPRAARKM